MAGDPKNPEVGELSIDATEFSPKDLTTEEIQALLKVHDGFDKAAEALINLKAADVNGLAFNTDELIRLGVLYAQELRYQKFVPAAEKLAELMREGQLQGRHDISVILAEMASQARRRGSKASNVLGPVQPLLEYQYGPAVKAAATREKAKKAEAEAEAKAKAEAEAAKAGPTPVSPPGGGATGPTG